MGLTFCITKRTIVTIIRGRRAIHTFKIGGVAVGAKFTRDRGDFQDGEYAIEHENKICLVKEDGLTAYVFNKNDIMNLEEMYK